MTELLHILGYLFTDFVVCKLTLLRTALEKLNHIFLKVLEVSESLVKRRSFLGRSDDFVDDLHNCVVVIAVFAVFKVNL